MTEPHETASANAEASIRVGPSGTILLGTGVVVMALGALAIAHAEVAARVSLTLLGIVLIAGGLIALAATLLARRVDAGERLGDVAASVIAMTAGTVLLARPAPAGALLTAVVGCLLIAGGGAPDDGSPGRRFAVPR